MKNSLDELRQLTFLAYRRDDNSRKILLQRITDIFLDATGSCTDGQRARFGDIMEQLAFTLEWELRAELACRIANEADAPRSLILRLANDVISVAQPILEQSPVLEEVDLIKLVRMRSQEHLLAITRRTDIRVRLSAALIDCGEDAVIANLLQNEQAEIASDTLMQAAESAGSGDGESDALWSALIDRRNTPKTVLLDLIETVSERLRQRLFDRLSSQDHENLEAAIETLRHKLANSQTSQAEQKVEALLKAGRLNQFALLRFAKEGKGTEFLLGLARLAEITVPEAWGIISDPTGTALAIVCRAQHFDVKSFKMIAMSAVTEVSPDPSSIYRLVCIYERLSGENAHQAMQHWRASKAKTEVRSQPSKAEAVFAAA